MRKKKKGGKEREVSILVTNEEEEACTQKHRIGEKGKNDLVNKSGRVKFKGGRVGNWRQRRFEIL